MTISSFSGNSTLAALNARAAASLHSTTQTVIPAGLPNSADPQTQNFADRLGDALERVNEAQAQANRSARAYETGATDNLASVMVDQQVSSLGFQMTMQVRNKALSAYRDIMNMPV
jgi:flagellar hook-basal body complex protein FliE